MQQVKNLQDLEEAIKLNGEVVVTKKNNVVILMSMEEYKKKLQEKEMEKKLLKAEEQIEKGETVKASLVFKELEEKYGF